MDLDWWPFRIMMSAAVISHHVNLCEQQWELSLPSGYADMSEVASDSECTRHCHLNLKL